MKLIPKLRFPEFENKEWNVSPIDDYCDVFRGSTFSKSDITEDGSEPCIHYGELFTKYNEVISKVYSRTDKQDGFKSEAGDVLMPSSDVTPDGLARASAITLGNVILGGDMNILRPYKGTNSIFLSYLLNHSKREIIKLVSGTTVKHIYPSQIITCELPVIDNEAEQQKIASCLSSLDELIAAHNDKLDALKDHKKGLLQNLFPQEGETVPNVRFPEFEDDGEWVEDILNEYLELLTDFEANGSFADVKKNVNIYDGKEYAWYVRATDLENNSEQDQVKYVDEHSYKFLRKTKLFGGELLITKRGEIGKVYFFNSFDGIPATVAPNMYLLKLNEKAIPLFFYYHFTNFVGNHSLKRLNASSTIGALYKDDVKKVELLTPPTIDEQQKIASCLSAVDELISAQQVKIEQLQQHKKGLMQGLFPKIES